MYSLVSHFFPLILQKLIQITISSERTHINKSKIEKLKDVTKDENNYRSRFGRIN